MSDDLTVGRINFLSNEPLQVSLGGTPFNKAHLDARAAEIKRLETALTEARAEIERLNAQVDEALRSCLAEREGRLKAESELATLRARVREVVSGMLAHSCVADAGQDCKDEEDEAAERAARQLMEEVK